AVSSSALVAIWKMKATSKIVIMSIIGMMLRWRIASPSGTRATALRMRARASRCVKLTRYPPSSFEATREEDVAEQRHRLRVIGCTRRVVEPLVRRDRILGLLEFGIVGRQRAAVGGLPELGHAAAHRRHHGRDRIVRDGAVGHQDDLV